MNTGQELQINNTQADTQNEPQQQLPEQANSCKNNKKNTIRIIIIISLILGSIILFFIIFFPIQKTSSHIFHGPPLSEYESYLTQRYKDDTFYYVSGDPSCLWFDSGFCRVQFSSTSLNGKTFTVTANRYRSYFSDDYYEIKYNFKLENYYHEKYSKLFEDTISNLTPYPVRIEVKNPSESSMRESSFDSFDDYIAALEQQEKSIEIYLMMVSSDIDIYNLDELDFTLIKSEVSRIVEQNNLKIPSVDLVVSSFKEEYTGTCPKEFDHTIRSSINVVYDNFYNYIIGTDDDPDGRPIRGCLLTIYQKEN